MTLETYKDILIKSLKHMNIDTLADVNFYIDKIKECNLESEEETMKACMQYYNEYKNSEDIDTSPTASKVPKAALKKKDYKKVTKHKESIFKKILKK